MKVVALGIATLWVIVQIVLIFFFWDKPQGSDPGTYIGTAKLCSQNGEYYPMLKHVNDSCIYAPGFVNYLILQLKLFNTVNFNMILNLIMNVGILAEIYYLAKRFFNERTGLIAAIAYCLLYSNLMIVVPAATEIPFLFLSLSALCLSLFPRVLLLIFAGILFALANWIRPLVLIFLLVALFYMYCKRYNWKYFISILLPMIAVMFSIGMMTKSKTGYFVYQSVTGGANLIMTANDKAYGGVATSLFRDTTTTVFIKEAEKYTFAQKDSIWKKRSMKWINRHPVKFAKLYCLKLGGLYIEDSWSDRPVLGGAGFIDAFAHGKVSKNAFILRAIKMGSKSFVYYIVGLLFIYSIVVNRRDIFTNKGLLLLILLFGTLITCLFPVSPRYHYPFMFVIVIWASYGIDKFLERKNAQNRSEN